MEALLHITNQSWSIMSCIVGCSDASWGGMHGAMHRQADRQQIPAESLGVCVCEYASLASPHLLTYRERIFFTDQSEGGGRCCGLF